MINDVTKMNKHSVELLESHKDKIDKRRSEDRVSLQTDG